VTAAIACLCFKTVGPYPPNARHDFIKKAGFNIAEALSVAKETNKPCCETLLAREIKDPSPWVALRTAFHHRGRGGENIRFFCAVALK
jgi:hypothetical protein